MLNYIYQIFHSTSSVSAVIIPIALMLFSGYALAVSFKILF